DTFDYLYKPCPDQPADTATEAEKAAFTAEYKKHFDVACIMLGKMSPALQRQFKNYPPQNMLAELRKMFEKPSAVEIYDLVDALYSCRQALDFGDFVRNFNMHCIGKTVTELHALLIDFEKGLKDKAPTSQVFTIQKGRDNKPKSQANKKVKGKGKADKNKQVVPYQPKPKPNPLKRKENLNKDQASSWRMCSTIILVDILEVAVLKRIQLKRDKSEQNRIKTRQKREAWRSPEESKAVSVDRARKTEENAKRMVKVGGADYNDEDEPIPFRRQVFSSSLDGKHFTGKNVEELIKSKSFSKLDDDDVVSLCCIVFLQLVLLGVKDRRADANVKRWLPLYATEPTNEVDKKSYSIFGFTWAFKTWILEGRVPAERLIADEIEVVSRWWVSRRAYFDGRISEAERRPHHLNRQNHYEDMSVGTGANKEPIIVDQHYGISDMSGFQSILPGSSNWQSQSPAYTPTPNWQPPIPSHPSDAVLCDPNKLERPRREHRPSVYMQSTYTPLPPTT
nr:hypothetical protein [Tanacetum cinerariifolium]